MCGIAGLATADGLRQGDRDLVDRMLATLIHRGPDDQHVAGDRQAWMGTRRLSIIDLDTGRQPVTNEDGSIIVSMNGEIYNYIELRAELLARGHRLVTNGDTETIVHLYEEYGDAFVDHLRGMFAIALWDSRRNRLILARDRLGKKPLYWRVHDGRLAWGSELKAILEDPDVERSVDQRSLELYLQYQYVPAPHTILKGIQKLRPASVLTWDGGEVSIKTYWRPVYEPKRHADLHEDTDACLDVLRESVALRLRSDVPVGVFLSGGMDSSVVAALMAELSSTPIRTYSIGFDERAFDELPYARAVAEHLGADATEEVVRLDAIALLPELAYHYDEPFGDSSAIPTFRVSQLAARDLKVVLTGDGGDEAFGGYLRYRFQDAMALLGHLPAPARGLLAASAQAALRWSPARRRIRRRAESWRRLATMTPDQRYVEMMSIFPGYLRAGLLPDAAADDDEYLLAVLRDGPPDGVDRLLHADTLSYLPEDLLVKADRATMANSLEARSPLLDHSVIEFAAALPRERKIHGGSTKHILRLVAKRLLPARLVDRPKQGFAVPIGTWFRGDLGDVYRDLVLGPEARIRDVAEQGYARVLFEDHLAGRLDHSHRLWELLMYELWARRWLGSGSRPVG